MAGRLTQKQTLRRVKVYLGTDNDHAAAKRLGVGTQSFTRWRESHKLPAKDNGR